MKFRRIKEVYITEFKVGDIWESSSHLGCSYWEVTSLGETINGMLRVNWRFLSGDNHTGNETGRFWMSAARKRWLVERVPARESSHFPCYDTDCECIWDEQP